MGRERIQTRDDPDVRTAVEQYADNADITESEAVRRLVRTGLAVKGYDSPAAVSDGDRGDDLDATVMDSLNTRIDLVQAVVYTLLVVIAFFAGSIAL